MRNVVLKTVFAVFAAAASARAQSTAPDSGAASWSTRDEVRIFHAENRSPAGNTGLTSLVPQREWIRSGGQGKWAHETELIAGGQIRVGHKAHESTSAAAVLNGFAAQKEEYHLTQSTHLYGRLEIGGRGGLGTNFQHDTPNQSGQVDGSAGVEHEFGQTHGGVEHFVHHVWDLSSPLRVRQEGFEVSVHRTMANHDHLEIAAIESRYYYNNGTSIPDYSVETAYLHHSKGLTWGPQLSYDHKGNSHRIQANLTLNWSRSHPTHHRVRVPRGRD